MVWLKLNQFLKLVTCPDKETIPVKKSRSKSSKLHLEKIFPFGNTLLFLLKLK